ncbi:MAG: hypothetical protein V3V18_12380 [Methylococcales bacterium]
MNLNRIVKTSFLLFCFSATMHVSSAFALPTWGSNSIGDRYRPITSWMSRFSENPHIIASGSVQAAVDQCDDVVGVNKYCVVEINNDSVFPVTISRPRVKLVGIEGTIQNNGPDSGDWIEVTNNVSFVLIEGLNLQGRNASDDYIAAIRIEGSKIRKVAVINNSISNFKSQSNAHAIAVYGTGGTSTTSIRHILIDGNTVHTMETGSSESIVVNGNVIRWAISHNDIWDINNIAIDAIGGEGTSPKRLVNGRYYPGRYDRARYGFIEDNYVSDMSTANNPAYDNVESWAAAIYIDGGSSINVRDNVVENSSWGYEIGAENCVITRNITIIGNSVIGSTFGDFLIGGYNDGGFSYRKANYNCDPDQTDDSQEGHGYVRHVTARENSFESTAVQEDKILPQFRVWNTIIADDAIEPINADRSNGRAPGDQNAIRTN